MGTTRVYEFARTCGVPARDLLAMLREAGFDAVSHMSALSSRELEFLRAKLELKVGEPAAIQKAKTSVDPARTESGPPRSSVEVDAHKRDVESVGPPPVANLRVEQHEHRKGTVSGAGGVHRPSTLPPPAAAPTPPGVRQATEVVKGSEVGVEKKPAPVDHGITIEPMAVADFALRVRRPAGEVILALLRMGIVASKNHVISVDVVARLADFYGLKTVKKAERHSILHGVVETTGASCDRPPVVVVVGHVDHGKTTLLDYIRKTRVAVREKGGITQHLGIYEVETKHGSIIFLDTPGHEAFAKMRGRGMGVADLVVLVVAADDGVMPQTVEAIKFAHEAKLPIIVAMNKVDKVNVARLDVVRRGLTQYNVIPEEWGGDVVCLAISAKTGVGVDQLLEMIVLQAQLMGLRADAQAPAFGHVLEARPERGLGPLATVLCKQGTVKIGDYFVCGGTVGKVGSLLNSVGLRVAQAGPSVPIQIVGFSALPEVGSVFKVVSYVDYRAAREALSVHAPRPQKLVAEGRVNFILKTDSLASKEAILESLGKLAKRLKTEFNIIGAGVGPVSESDVVHAAATKSSILALHVKPDANVSLVARNSGVSIAVFDVIYRLLEHLEETFERTKKVAMVKTKIGEAVVRQVFAIKGVGVVAGCYVRDGRFLRDGLISVYRQGAEIGSGKIKSLQRERKTIKEVHAGLECGFVVDGFDDFLVDDRVDCFIEAPPTK